MKRGWLTKEKVQPREKVQKKETGRKATARVARREAGGDKHGRKQHLLESRRFEMG